MCHAVTDTGVDIGVDIDTDTDADTRTQSCKHDMGGAPEAGVPILCHRERERQNERVRERASWRAREKAFHIRQRHALVTCTHSSRWSAFSALKEEGGGFRRGTHTHRDRACSAPQAPTPVPCGHPPPPPPTLPSLSLHNVLPQLPAPPTAEARISSRMLVIGHAPRAARCPRAASADDLGALLVSPLDGLAPAYLAIMVYAT